MTDTQEPSTTRAYTADINRMARAVIKKTWPKWSAKQYSLKKDTHSGFFTDFYWLDHATIAQMKELLDQFHWPGPLGRPPTVFEFDGKQYHSTTMIHYHRIYSMAFLKRIAVVFCRRHQVSLPEVRPAQYYGEAGAKIREEENEPAVDGYKLSKAIMLYAATVAEADLERLEKETDEQYPPLPTVDQAVQEKRDEAADQRIRNARASADYTRQNYQYQIAVFSQIPGRESLVAELQSKAHDLAKRIRRLSPDLYEPVLCTGCLEYAEEEQCQKGEHPHLAITRYLCTSCRSQGKVLFYPDPQHLIDEVKALDQEEREADEVPYEPVLDESGVYRAKNGEAMPILTRDLLHDVRVSKWWFWFGPDRGDVKVPSQEVRDALYKAGWRWGYRRKQYHTSNQFGVLHIPEIVYEQYGGYIDGGFCDYRSTRGARLREYAVKVEGQADEMAEWSEQIVAKYMATGSIVTGGRRTRKLLKEKARAEKKAAEARRLDAYAYELRQRANSSERYQQYLASDEMLPRRLETLHSDLRKYDRDFLKSVDYTGYNLYYEGGTKISVRWYVKHYFDFVQPHKDIIQEEIDIIQATIEARQAGQKEEPEEQIPVPVPEIPERTFTVNDVVEVNVGSDNYSDLFPTHPDIADLILDEFPIPATAKFVLEPNGGTGSYLARIRHHLGESAQIHTYEWLYDLNKHLTEQGYQVLGYDFLEATLPDNVKEHGGYDDIAMNPPFKEWEKHLLQAWKMTRPGGRIRCTIPHGAHTRSRYVRLMQEIAFEFQVFDLPDDAFKHSGTSVHTSVLYLVKREKAVEPPDPERNEPPIKEEVGPTRAACELHGSGVQQQPASPVPVSFQVQDVGETPIKPDFAVLAPSAEDHTPDREQSGMPKASSGALLFSEIPPPLPPKSKRTKQHANDLGVVQESLFP